jgi:hypothetical protein
VVFAPSYAMVLMRGKWARDFGMTCRVPNVRRTLVPEPA